MYVEEDQADSIEYMLSQATPRFLEEAKEQETPIKVEEV